MVKLVWSVDNFKPCCHNCINMIDNGKTFDCKLDVEIENNHWTNLNNTTCRFHKYNKKFKLKIRKIKNKSAYFKVL